MPQVDPSTHLDALKEAYDGGDVLALLQAVRYAQSGAAALPRWAMEPLDRTLVGIITKSEKGKKGKGNSPFGQLRKDFVRAVRASAYHSVRAWQKNPHNYVDMPRASILLWYKETDADMWLGWKTYSDAARLAGWGLVGTAYEAKASTVRKAAVGIPPPVSFGRRELEWELGLRGPEGVFGPPSGHPPKHVKQRLSKHPTVS